MKKQLFLKLSFLLVLALFSSCDNSVAEDDVSTVDKSGSVEVEFQSKHIDEKTDVLITKRTIWKGGGIVKSLTTLDTVPSLGSTKEVGENENGDEKEIIVIRDYEFFVTIK